MGQTENFLTVETGEPFAPGTNIALSGREISIGRAGQTHRPDIVFASQYISRQHAVIKIENDRYWLIDLDSKHGTKINDTALSPNQAYPLHNGDRISLAKDTVVLAFQKTDEPGSDDTVSFTSALPVKPGYASRKFFIDPDRREVQIDGSCIQLFGKDMDLLMLLFRHKNKAVSYSEIKKDVWPERLFEDDGIPDVGGDEISALIYRLRKRLGQYGTLIRSIPRYGYILDLLQE